ncbi:hypothetical protein BGX27_005162 [Mortierella sp. AM989]|nr:hypothetical protein BGX27_005162 [Mortierella sp. AM989]
MAHSSQAQSGVNPTLDPTGLDYILKGDKCRDNGQFKDAAKYYEKATKYCPDKARERLDELPIRNPSSYDSSGSTSAGWRARMRKAKESLTKKSRNSTLQPTLMGPFFPNLPEPQPTSVTQSEDNKEYAIPDNTTRSLVASFTTADVTGKAAIRNQISLIIKQSEKTPPTFSTIQELVMLSTIPDRDIFLNIINQILKVLRDSPILSCLVLHGLVVMLTSCSEGIDLTDMHGVFLDILKPLTVHLSNVHHQNNDHQLTPLLQALSALLDAMVCRKVHALDRSNTHAPLSNLLDGLSSHVNATIRFLALYAKQALAFIGNNETLTVSVFRRGALAFALAGNVKDIVTSVDLGKFEAAYRNFTSLCDVTLQYSWYQALVYLDCVARREDWSRFEDFVTGSKFKSINYFLQGVCLRVEQIAATHQSNEIRRGAARLLQALAENPTPQIRQISLASLQRLKVPQDEIPPAWNSIWLAAPADILLRAVKEREQRHANIDELPEQFENLSSKIQSGNAELKKAVETKIEQLETDIGNLNVSIEKAIGYMPAPASLDEVRDALQSYYKSFLTIQRVSGETMRVGSCYINLAIVEVPGQRQKDKSELKAHAEAFHRMHSYENMPKTNMNAQISLEELFKTRKLRDGREGTPKTVLVQGRAGIGKTTLCKKLVHLVQGGLWKDRYDAVLWLPLRQIRTLKARNLEDLLSEKFFSQQLKQKREALVSRLAGCVNEGRILFILDGLDEIILDAQSDEGFVLAEFLKSLLHQNHVVITSRPSGLDTSMLPNLDLELETVGFSSQNVTDYITKVLSPYAAKSAQEFIEQTPLIQGLVNIPVQLDVICYSWDSLPPNGQSITMTGLYQTMVRKLWCKDALRLQKSIDGQTLSHQQIKRLRPYQIDHLMNIEIEYLGYLAFKGMQNNHQVEFDESALVDAIEDLDEFRVEAGQSPLPLQILDRVKETSFLHTVDADVGGSNDPSNQAWHFLHLTFQEFFAASWLARHLRIKYQSSKTSGSVTSMTEMQVIEFIQHHKYNPRYEIVWWMVAGHLQDLTLESLFDLLQAAPRDLIGIRHQLLIAGCLKEARPQLKEETICHLETELMHWLQFDMALFGNGNYEGILGRQNIIPEELLVRNLNGSKKAQIYTLRTLQYRTQLMPITIEKLSQMVCYDDTDIKILATDALGCQPNLPESAIFALISALGSDIADVRSSAADALGHQTMLSETAAVALVSVMCDKDLDVRNSTNEGLYLHTMLPNKAVTVLARTLKEKDWRIRSSAAIILGRQSELPGYAAVALITALRDEVWDVRISAEEAFHGRAPLPRRISKALNDALNDKNLDLRRSAADALGLSRSPADTLGAKGFSLRRFVADVEDDKYLDHGESVLDALSSQISPNEDKGDYLNMACQTVATNDHEPTPNPTTTTPTNPFPHPPPKPSFESIQSVDYQLASELSTLAKQIKPQEGSSEVRISTAESLLHQPTLPDAKALNLVLNLSDSDFNVRQSAVNVLCNQPKLSESVISELIKTLQSENWNTCFLAATILGHQSKLPEFAVSFLIDYFLSGDASLSAHVLVRQSNLRTSAVMAIAGSLKCSKKSTRIATSDILGSQSTLPDSVSIALANLFQDNDWDIQMSAANALANQTTLPESAISVITNILQDKDWYLRRASAVALCHQSKLPNWAATVLASALYNNDLDFKRSVANALESKTALPEPIAIALISLLQERDFFLRSSISGALSRQCRLSDNVVGELVCLLASKDPEVVETTALILGKQSSLPKFAVLRLSDTLQNEDPHVRRSAADALANQSSLPDTAVLKLLKVLQDKYPSVRQSATKALGAPTICLAIVDLLPIEIENLYRNFLTRVWTIGPLEFRNAG